MKIWNGKAYVLRRIARLGMAGWNVGGFEKTDSPAVYLVHHQNMFGPVHTLAFLPEEAHLWALAPFCEQESCRRQYENYTLTKRFGWPSFLARPASFLFSLIVPGVMEAFGAIPVYRGSREIRKTMEESGKALRRGESLLICPDVDYTDRSPKVGRIYRGFLHLDREYFQECQAHLSFIPVFCSKQEKRVVLGNAVRFPGKESFHQECCFMVNALQAEWNRLGSLCGDLAGKTEDAFSQELI